MITDKLILDAEKLISTSSHSYRYFFESLSSIEWLIPFRDRGYFKRPPKIETAGDTYRFPDWPDLTYLIRVADQNPVLVMDTILKMEETDNSWVHSDCIEAALKMPPRQAKRIVERVSKWLTYNRLAYKFPESVAKLAIHISRLDSFRSSQVLISKLLDLKVRKTEFLEYERVDATFRLASDWEIKKLVKKITESIDSDALEKFIETLVSKYDEVAVIERETIISQPKELIRNDSSAIWRPYVSSHHQNITSGADNVLVDGIREASEYALKTKNIKFCDLDRKFRESGMLVLHRLILYLASRFDLTRQELASMLLEREYIKSILVWQEYSELLEKRFEDLSKRDKDKFFKIFDEISPEEGEGSDEEAQNSVSFEGEEFPRNFLKYRLRVLAVIEAHLPSSWRKSFENLKELLGEPEYPFRPVRHEFWVGPTSPLNQDQLVELSDEQLVTYLRNWTPHEGWRETSAEGLARIIENATAAHPSRFASLASEFIGLELNYCKGLLYGLQKAIRAKKKFSWTQILKLCEWIVNVEIHGVIVFKGDEKTQDVLSWTRQAVVRLIHEALSVTGQRGLPVQSRKKVWEIIESVLDDPDPKLESEMNMRNKGMRNYELAINATRSQALEAAIHFGHWVVRPKKGLRSLAMVPGLQAALEEKIDLNSEHSFAVRSVFGRWLPALHYIDSKWLVQNIEKILPDAIEKKEYFEAAWESYLLYNGISLSLYSPLMKQYSRAVEMINPDAEDEFSDHSPELRLGNHLVAFYLHGKLKLDSEPNLLKEYLKNASMKLRHSLISSMGRNMEVLKKSKFNKFKLKFEALWEYIFDLAAKEASKGNRVPFELISFGWWIIANKFPHKWWIEQANRIAELTGSIQPQDWVIEILAESKFKGNRELRLIKTLVEKRKSSTDYPFWVEKLTPLIEHYASYGSKNQKIEVESIIDTLVSLGFHKFRDL